MSRGVRVVVFCQWASGLLLLTLLPCPASLAADRSQAAVRIALRPTTVVRGRLVTIADLADIEGGDDLLRQRVAALDVAELKTTAAPQAISRRLVQIRLLLAGVSANLCEVTGADRVMIVRAPTGLPDRMVVAAIQTELARRFGVDAADLAVKLAQPLTTKVELEGIAPDDLRLEPLVPAILPLGRTRMQIDIHVQGRLRDSPTAVADIGVYQTVAKVVGLIGRGETLSREKVLSERIRTAGSGFFLSPAEVVGRKVNRAMRAGEAIRLQDLEEPRAEESPVLVKPHDTVQLVVRKGQLIVVLSAAEALQQGRQGDVIRVMNPESKKIITGRVISRSELEVAL